MALASSKLYILRDVDGVATKFPSEASPLILTTYTYSAQRMGSAPTLEATVYYDCCLDKEWTKEEYIEFNGERFYVDRIPSSTKDTSTHLYKHEITLTSRRQILDNTLFFDAVSDSDTDTSGGDAYRSNMTSFTFGGTIEEFVARINSSLIYCDLYDTATQSGYKVVIDDGYATDEVQEISFEDKYITEVLQEIYNTYGLNYYWVGKVCHVGDIEYEAGDVISYGVHDALLSVDKQNSNNQLVDMATGYGSSDNIPYYYPNEDAYGTAIYETENCQKSDVFEVSLGTVMGWNGDVYNKALSLVRYTATSFDKYLGNPDAKQMTNVPDTIVPGKSSDFVKVKSMGIPTAYTVGLKDFFAGNSPKNVAKGIGVETTLGYSYGYGDGSSFGVEGGAGYEKWQRYLEVTRAFKINKAKFNEIIRLEGTIEDLAVENMWATRATEDDYEAVAQVHVKTEYQQANFYSYLVSVRVFTPNGGKSASEDQEEYDMFSKEYWDASTIYTGTGDDYQGFAGAAGGRSVQAIPAIEYTVKDDTDEIWVVATYYVYSYCYAGEKLTTPGFPSTHATTDVFVRASLVISGGITRVFSPTNHQYYIVNEDETLKAYEESGITFLGIANLPAITYSYSYDATEGWVISIDKSAAAATIRITGRDWTYPASSLMPSIYRNSAGKERFLYALNNTHLLPDSSDEYYTFENQYTKGNPHQGVESFDDIKPTIKDMKNASGELIGEVLDVAYDENDNDNTTSSSSGTEEYQHPYFYIKLHKFDGENGFDLFKHALESDTAKIEMTECQGCPACAFEIQKGTLDANTNSFFNPVKADSEGNIWSGDYGNKIVSSYADITEYNQSTETNEVWIAVKKDNSTLGVVMPNVAGNFKVKKGDKFVITGIKMPASYVRAAEKRLDEAIVKWMSENNSEEFSYSIKFSRVYLAQHPEFAKRLNENTRLHVKYNGVEHVLYVSDYTLKADNDVLDEASVELTEELGTNGSDAQSIANSLSDVIGVQGGGTGSSLTMEMIADQFLSKRKADTALGKIRFAEGLAIGNERNGIKIDKDGCAWFNQIESPDFSYAEQSGYSIYEMETGKYKLALSALEVWGKATFNELEIRKVSYTGGSLILSSAGSTIVYALPRYETYTEDGLKYATFTKPSDDAKPTAYRCWLLADNGTTATQNTWHVDDQARCQTFNAAKVGETTKAENKYYWRLVTAVSQEAETVRDANGVELFDGHECQWIDLSPTDYDTTSEDLPAAGDVIVQMGNRSDTARQNLIMMQTEGDEAPFEASYQGVNSYSLSGCLINRIGNLKGETSPLFGDLKDTGIYTENIYATGDFTLRRTGEDLDTKFQILEDKFSSRFAKAEDGLTDDANFLHNGRFNLNNDGEIDGWTEQGDDGEWYLGPDGLPLMINGQTTKDGLDRIVLENVGGKKVLHMYSANGNTVTMSQANELIKQPTTHTEYTEPEYTTKKDGNGDICDVTTTKEAGSVEVPDTLYLSAKLLPKAGTTVILTLGETQGSTIAISKTYDADAKEWETVEQAGTWDGKGGFTLTVDGDCYVTDVMLTTDSTENLKASYETSITQTAKEIELQAAKTTNLGTQIGYVKVEADKVSAKVTSLEKGLEDTGIDITDKKILATADNFVVRNNNGTTTMTIDKDGNLCTSGDAAIKGTVYATNGEFTGKVTATSGTFNGTVYASNGEFSGTIHASQGTIGNWIIGKNRIGAGYTDGGHDGAIVADSNGLFLYNNMIGFNETNRQALLGTLNNWGAFLLCRLYDTHVDTSSYGGVTSTYTLGKVGLSINIRNSDVCNDAIQINGGCISGLNLRTEYINSSGQTIKDLSNAVFLSSRTEGFTVYMPNFGTEKAYDGHVIMIKRHGSYTPKIVCQGTNAFIFQEGQVSQTNESMAWNGCSATFIFFPSLTIGSYSGVWVEWRGVHAEN